MGSEYHFRGTIDPFWKPLRLPFESPADLAANFF